MPEACWLNAPVSPYVFVCFSCVFQAITHLTALSNADLARNSV